MLSVNDIALAADANEQWAETGDRTRAAMRNAARGYFVRVLLSHVYEGLLIVEEISQSANLRSAVDECDKQAISAFRFLEDVVKSREMKVFHALRNRATFHYDRQLPLLSFEEISEKQPERQWSCSAGSEPLDWRFELADAVVDRMMIREVFRLRGPRGPERTAKTEELALDCRTFPTDLQSSRSTSSATFRGDAMAMPTMSPDEERFMAFDGPCAPAKLAAAVWILGQQPDAASAIILRATSAAR